MSEQPKAYILYVRKSTEDKSKQVQSIEGQLQIMKKRADTEGFVIVRTIEESKTAKTPGVRPGFKQIVGLIESGEADGIICWHLNRIARNPKEMGEIQQLLIDEKLKAIVTADRTYRPEDNALLMSIETGMSTQYVRDLSVSVRRGMQQKVEKGWTPRQPTIGYINDRELRIIINDPERYGLVKLAWEMLLSGEYSVNHIARVAAKEWGLTIRPSRNRGGKPITDTHMHRVFKNKFYAGIITYKGQEYPGNHEPMITLEEFEYAQRLISRKTTYRKRRDEKIDHYLYRGLITCGECGCSITFTRKTRRHNTYEYCHCTKRRKQLQCSQPAIKQEHLTEMLKNEIKQYEIGDEFYKWACKHIDAAVAVEDRQMLDVLIAKEELLQNTKNYLDNLQQRLVRNQIDDDFYHKELVRTKKEIKTQESSLKKAEEKRKNWKTDTKELLTLCRYADEEFESDSPERRRIILRKIGRNIQMSDGRLLFNPAPGLLPIKNANEMGDILKKEVGTPLLQRKDAPLEDVLSQWYTRQDSNL